MTRSWTIVTSVLDKINRSLVVVGKFGIANENIIVGTKLYWNYAESRYRTGNLRSRVGYREFWTGIGIRDRRDSLRCGPR